MLSPVLRLQPCGDFLIWTRLLSHCRRTHLKFIIWSYLPCLGGIFWAVSWRFLIGPEMFSHLQSPPAPDAQGSSGNGPTRGPQSLGAPIRPHPRPGTLKCGIRGGRGTGRLRKAHHLISQGTEGHLQWPRGLDLHQTLRQLLPGHQRRKERSPLHLLIKKKTETFHFVRIL